MTCGPLCGQLWLEDGEPYIAMPGDFERVCSECPRRGDERSRDSSVAGGGGDGVRDHLFRGSRVGDD